MGTDIYQPCPCGSGKKLKFCCVDIFDDMQKIGRLQEKGSFDQALSVLDRIEAKPKLHDEGRYWSLLTRATILMSAQKPAEAEGVLDQLLELVPDHLLAIALKATANFSANGFDAARTLIHRAFRKCAGAYPELVSSLAMGIAGEMHGAGKYLSAREHLTLAMRTAPEQDRQEVFMHLLQFEGNSAIPYPLRSVHQIQTPEFLTKEEAGADAEEMSRVRSRAGKGCWTDAATRLERLLESHPDESLLWMDLGYVRGFDGDEEAAAKALHTAATKTEKFGQAVEWETVAQLIDLQHGEQKEVRTVPLTPGSVTKLLTRLDDAGDRVIRMPLPPPRPEDNPAERPAAIYDVLDRAVSEGEADGLNRESCPRIIGQLVVYSAHERTSAIAWFSGTDPERWEEALHLIREAAGEELLDNEEETPEVDETIAAEYAAMQFRFHFPPGTSGRIRQRILLEEWDHLLNNVWLKTPLTALSGKTPEEAAGDESLKAPLMAAIHVLDSFCDRNRYHLDLNAICERLQVPIPEPVELDDQTSLQSFSILKLHRVPVGSLDDRQLQTAVNRGLLVNHRRFLAAVLDEVASRPHVLSEMDADRVYLALTELAEERNNRESALDWIQRGKAEAKESQNEFENLFRWEMREMAFRLEDPSDPEWKPIVMHVWDYYGRKIPRIRDHIANMLTTLGLPLPEGGLVTGDNAGGTTSGGVWTPDAAGSTAPPESGGKLWIPGQD